MQAGVKDLEADMSNAAGDPTTTFCLKGRGTRFKGKIDLATIDGRNRGRLAPLTTTFTLMRSSDTSKVLHELNCSSLNAVASVRFGQP
jgi:hypothetical protein